MHRSMEHFKSAWCELAAAAVCCFPRRASSASPLDDEDQPPKNTSPPGGWNGALDNVPWDDLRLDWPLLYEDGTLQTRGIGNKYNTERRLLVFKRHEAEQARIAASPLGRLCAAAQNGSVADALDALAAGAPVNGPREKHCNEPPLSVAAEAGSVEVARLLLQRGADVEQRDRFGATPLRYAASGESVAMIELLVAAGADVNAPDNGRWTPLFYAITTGDKVTAEALMCAGASVQGTGLRAPLYFAGVHHSDRLRSSGRGPNEMAGIMQLLLDAGAAIDAHAPEDECTALEAAVSRGHVPAAQVLLSRGADPTTVRPHAIRRAEKSGSSDSAEVLKLLRAALEQRAAQQPPPTGSPDEHRST